MPAPMTMTSKSGSAVSVIGTPSFQRGSDRRHELVQVADEAVVGLAEDRGVRVGVDRHDDLRALHADHVLQLAGDADGEVELRGDVRACAADVAVLAHPVQAFGHRPGTGDLGADRRGQRLDEGEVLLGLEAAADADHPVGRAAGLATLVEIGRLLGRGAAARTAFARFVFASEATYQIEGPQALTPFLALAEPPLDGNPVTVIPEQEVLQYDSTHPGQALAARYPLTATSALGSPELNYPYVITASQPAELTIVREFRQLLGQGYAAGVLRFDGFRSAGDVADAAPGKYGLATQLLQIATPPASSEAQTALQAWQQLDINYKDLALIA